MLISSRFEPDDAFKKNAYKKKSVYKKSSFLPLQSCVQSHVDDNTYNNNCLFQIFIDANGS